MEPLPDRLDKRSRLDRIVPFFAITYAVWTMYVHAMTATHSSFDTLMRWLPLIVLLAIVIAWRWFKLPTDPVDQAQIPVATAAPTQVIRYPYAVLALAVLWTTILVMAGNYVLFWWGSIIALGAAWIATIHADPIAFRREPINGRMLWIVLVVALAAACVTLIANRPDADDAFYQSIPATLLRLPAQPVLLHDTIYRVASQPIQLPVYRMHSYEVLIGVLARVTGVQPAVIAYLVLPPLFAILCVIAWAQLLRLLAPKNWPWTLAILFSCVLMLGEAHHSYGNFAFVRMFQGKAILTTFIVPCIVGLAIDYSRDGSLRSWIALFAVQIAAIGITSSGLFVAPAAAGMALIGMWSPNAVSTRRLAFGALASSYLFVAAVIFAVITHGGQGVLDTTAMPSMLPWLDQELGSWTTVVLLTALFAAWSFAEGRAQARLFLASALCFLLVVLNPYAYQWIALHVTGTMTYWRLFWALPAPLMLAILFGNAIEHATRIRPKALAFATCVAFAVGAAVFAQHAGSLRKDNAVSLGMPGLKVPDLDYALAKKFAASMPESATILAPESVATWLPTFAVHPQLLASRGMYLIDAFGKDDGSRRLALQLYIEGWQRSADAPAELAGASTRYALSTIVVTHAASWRVEIATILTSQGWRSVTDGPYDIWTRTPTPAPLPPDRE